MYRYTVLISPSAPQELICLRAIRDVNVPKFLQDDLKLFNGIVSDLFPKIKEEPIDYGALEESIRNVCKKRNLKDVDGVYTGAFPPEGTGRFGPLRCGTGRFSPLRCGTGRVSTAKKWA